MRTALLVCLLVCCVLLPPACAVVEKSRAHSLPVQFLDGEPGPDTAWVCVPGKDDLACISLERFLQTARERGLIAAPPSESSVQL